MEPDGTHDTVRLRYPDGTETDVPVNVPLPEPITLEAGLYWIGVERPGDGPVNIGQTVHVDRIGHT